MGAPASFREEITISDGRIFRLPDPNLVGVAGLRRGGYLFAAGLLAEFELDKFCPVFVDFRFPELAKISSVLGAAAFPDYVQPRCAVNYALSVLEDCIKPVFRSEHTSVHNEASLALLEVADNALRFMCRQLSGSGLDSRLHGTPLAHCQYTDTQFSRSLSTAECAMGIQLFCSKDPLTREQTGFVMKKLLGILALLVKGVYHTYQHRNNRSFELRGINHTDIAFTQNKTVYLAYSDE